MKKMKYVRLGDGYNDIVIFPTSTTHDTFANIRHKPISAGFCYISSDKIECFGYSESLQLDSHEDDSMYATKQYFD